jgi:tetratricopeptide (TPR) repeat protein
MNCFCPIRILLSFVLLFLSFHYGKAQTAYEKKLIQSIRLERNAKKQYLRMLSLGEYYKTINIHRADSMRQLLLVKSSEFEDSIRFSALMFSAEVNRLSGDQEEYFKDILSCEPFLYYLKSDRVRYTLYHHLGYYYSISKEYRTAKFYLESASKIALKKRNNAAIADNYNFMALHYMLRNDKDSALYFSDLALKYGRRSSGKNMLDQCLNTQSAIYYHFGQIELSVAKNILAADWAERTGDLYHLAQYYREIGMSQRQIRNLDDAEFYLLRSFNYSQRIADYRQMGLSLINIGYVRYERKEYEAAIGKAEQALRIMNKLRDANGLGEAYNLLGIVNREKKAYSKSAICLNKALVYFESTGNQDKIAEAYHNVGTVFIKQQKYLNALHYLNRSVDIRNKSGNQNQIYESYRVMSEVYRLLGQSAKALDFMYRYVNYMDSNSLVMATKKIADLSENYRSEQRFRLIQNQADSIEQQRKDKILTETKLENSQLRNNFQLYIIIALLIVSILAGIIFFYRSNQVKIKQLQREAEMAQTLLRAQMNPHFVFNAMSVIQSYIYENDTVNSSKFLVNFSRLMRLILENSPKEFIPLDTEVEILKKYLETQKLRFGDRFIYEIEVEDGILSEYAVIPPMITQPFIENAIEHGQLHTIENGYIRICFRRSGKLLEVIIEDNGIGRAGSEQNKKSNEHKSMAMGITRERIQNLNNKYGTEGSLEVRDLDLDSKTGTKVLISLPYKEDNLAPSKP